MAQLRARSVRFFGLLTVMVLLAVIAAYVALHPSAAVPKNEPADQLDVNASALDSTAPMIARPLVPDSLNNFPDSRLVAYYTAGAPDAAVYRVPFQVPIYPDSIWVRWVMDRIAYIAWLDNHYIELTSQFPKEYRDPEPDWTSIQITSVDLETDGNPEFIFALDYGSHLYTVVLKYHGAATPEGLLREDTWECVGFMSAGHSIRFRQGGLTLVAGAGNSEQWVLAGGRMIETEQLISRENPTYGSCSAHTSGG